MHVLWMCDAQWGGAGIVINSESSVTGANRGRDSGTTTLRPSNGTDGIGLTSTGGGFPGARVRKHHGQEDTSDWYLFDDEKITKKRGDVKMITTKGNIGTQVTSLYYLRSIFL